MGKAIEDARIRRCHMGGLFQPAYGLGALYPRRRMRPVLQAIAAIPTERRTALHLHVYSDPFDSKTMPISAKSKKPKIYIENPANGWTAKKIIEIRGRVDEATAREKALLGAE